jgi:transposase
VKGFEHETDVATLREALRLLALENERLTRLNLELQKALAEAKGERVEQLELEIAQLQQTVAARNQALFGDSSERRPSSVAPAAKPPQKQSGHGPRKQSLPIVERVHELDVADRMCTSCGGELSE